jgi:O-antigen/teichoic acid export membrane protein
MWQFAVCTVLTNLCSFLALVLLAGHLPVASYGLLAFGLTLQSYLFALGCLGSRIVIVRECMVHPGTVDRVLTSHVLLTGGASAILSMLVLAGAAAAPLSLPERLLLACLAMGNIASCVNIQPFFDVHRRQPTSAFLTLVAEVVALVAIACLCASGNLGLLSAGLTFALKWIGTAMAHYLVYHYSVRPLRLEWGIRSIYSIFPSSLPVMCSSLVATLPFSLGIILVRLGAGDSAAGVLAIAQQAALAYILIATVGNRIIHPQLAGRRSRERHFMRQLVTRYGGFLLVLLLGSATVGATLAGFILGPQYRGAIIPMLLLLTAAMIHCLGGVGSAYLVMKRAEVQPLLANTAGLVFYLAGCCLVVPRYSCNGAAFMTLAATAFGAVIILARVSRHLGRECRNRGRANAASGESMFRTQCGYPVPRWEQ